MSYLKYSIHETLLIISVIINTVTIVHNPTVVPNPSVATTEIYFYCIIKIISYKLQFAIP